MSIFKLLLPVLLFFSCKSESPVIQEPVKETPTNTSAKTYLALGDSYTIGEKVNEEDRFPQLLTSGLQSLGVDMAEPEIVAQTGWRTDDLIRAIASRELKESYDLVSLLIGVNNQFQGRPIEDYEREFLELLETSIELAGGRSDRVVVVSIPDYAFTPFGQSRPNPSTISKEIDEYNAINQQIAQDNEVLYFDFTTLSRRGLTDETLIGIDNLHPSGKMYALLVDTMLDKVTVILE